LTAVKSPNFFTNCSTSIISIHLSDQKRTGKPKERLGAKSVAKKGPE
jgi:hypothetical protein